MDISQQIFSNPDQLTDKEINLQWYYIIKSLTERKNSNSEIEIIIYMRTSTVHSLC